MGSSARWARDVGDEMGLHDSAVSRLGQGLWHILLLLTFTMARG
jgi:hypothetical protein